MGVGGPIQDIALLFTKVHEHTRIKNVVSGVTLGQTEVPLMEWCSDPFLYPCSEAEKGLAIDSSGNRWP